MEKEVNIVIIGTGFGGIYTLKYLHKLFHDNKKIKITLIGEKNYFLFTPLLHEVATGSITAENIIEPIRKIFGCCTNELIIGKAEKINLEEKTIKVKEDYIKYDYLVISPGSETNFYNTKGAEENCLTLKSIEDALKIKNKIIESVEEASRMVSLEERRNKLSFTVIGGGPTGVELIAEMSEFIKDNLLKYYKKELKEDLSIYIVQKNKELLPQFSEGNRKKSLDILIKKGIKVLLEEEVKEITDNFILLNKEKKIYTDTVIWTAGIKPKEILFNQEIQKSKDGRILVNKYLQLENQKNIFGLGDYVAFKNENSEIFLPTLAQVAQKEAKVVAKNISLLIKNKSLEPFIYKHKGSMVSVGKWMALGEISSFIFNGKITWWIWKTLYLSKLLSFRKKIKVAFDWTINIFYSRDISRI